MGYIETIGLVAAIAAADAAVKAANVSLIGREISKGNGMVTVKIAGEVSAVKAAIAAATSAAGKVGSVFSTDVIPRPAPGSGRVLSYNMETMGAVAWLEEMNAHCVNRETQTGAAEEPILPVTTPEEKKQPPDAEAPRNRRKPGSSRKNNQKKGG
jgi:microcompartment protein CcmL/EutN